MTMNEHTLWAVKIGDEDWQEQVITSTKNEIHFEKAKAWAIDNGFDRLRISVLDLNEKPDFVKGIKSVKA